MIQVFFDERGSGKSRNLVNLANEEAKECKGNLIYIDDDNKRMLQLNRKVRLIPLNEFYINNNQQFYGFLCGIMSKDFDIKSVYIDGVSNMLSTMKHEDVGQYFSILERLSEQFDINFYVNVHSVRENIPECIKKYVA